MTPAMPDSVYTIWTIGLVVTLVVWVPVAVYSLHRAWRAAQSIQRYAAETLTAAAGIVQHTAAIGALSDTIGVATDMVTTAGAVEQKLGAVTDLLASRAR
jgi:hypothetical protein